MNIGTISSNILIQHVSGVLTNKQVSSSDVDENITATLENAQNIGDDSVRKVEQISEADSGTDVQDNDELLQQNIDEGVVLDIVV